MSAKGQSEHEGIQKDERKEHLDRYMIEDVLLKKGGNGGKVEAQYDDFDAGADGEPKGAVYGLPVETLSEKEKRNDGKIDKCEPAVLEVL